MKNKNSKVETIKRPTAKKSEYKHVFHNDVRVDYYEWLRDKESKEVIDYIKAQNEYTKSRLADLKPLEDKIYDEIKRRIPVVNSVPVKFGDWWYVSQSVENKNYSVKLRIHDSLFDLSEGEYDYQGAYERSKKYAQVFFDCNEAQEKSGSPFFAMGVSAFTKSGKYYVYSEDAKGDELFTLHIRKLNCDPKAYGDSNETRGELLSDHIEGTTYNVLVTPDEKYILYTTCDAAHRQDKIRCHKIGTDSSRDVLLYHDSDERFNVTVDISCDERYLIATSVSTQISENSILPVSELDKIYANGNKQGAGETAQESSLRANLFTKVFRRRNDIKYFIDFTHNDNEEIAYIFDNETNKDMTVYACRFEYNNGDLLFEDKTFIAEGKKLASEISDLDLYKDYVFFSSQIHGIEEVFYFKASDLKLDKTGGKYTGKTISDNSDNKIHNNTDERFSDSVYINKDLNVEKLSFDEELYDVSVPSNPEFDADEFLFSYSSYVTPGQVYLFVPDKNEKHIVKRQEINNYDSNLYTQKRLFATAEDGTKIPLSVIYKKVEYPGSGNECTGADNECAGSGNECAGADNECAGSGNECAGASNKYAGTDNECTNATGTVLTRFGEKPRSTILYGYGSYGASMNPHFSASLISLLDRGVVYVIAHIRGGGENGYYWYEDGKKLKKINTFKDFVSSAKFLIAEGISSKKNIVISGRSAGGLLMGAVTNMAPELFSGVLAGVPFVDSLTTMLKPELPLTVDEWEEWGDPLHNKEFYYYMKSYAPYDNVDKTKIEDYPKILAKTSMNDVRVLYVEPTKWVTKLQECGADALLLTEAVAGHFGASGRYNQYREIAGEYAWMLGNLKK